VRNDKEAWLREQVVLLSWVCGSVFSLKCFAYLPSPPTIIAMGTEERN
jgi:hypothetical protein